jgi:4-amino-4-deoxy-L-arabinose transferase-like glycosyltransferase
MEVPPAISVIGWLSRGLFRDTLFAVKVFPVLVGVMTIFLLGIFIKELGGGRSAQIIGATSFLLSPAFLGSNGLFQPVSFNQFFWFLTAFALLKTLNYRESNQNDSIKHWLALGVIVGLGILTKYSIAFFLIAIFVGMLFTKHRGVFLTKYSYIAELIALVIAAPNLWWQYSHDFPIIRHMTNLRATQLVNVTWQSFFRLSLFFTFWVPSYG